MPKIIDDAANNILNTARKMLFEKGYSAFTLRAVAAECGVAVGTIYNYFSGKNVLIASIMANDWFSALSEMNSGINSADTLSVGLRAIYDAISAFSGRYEAVWAQFNQSIHEPGLTPDRHLLLRGQLTEQLETLARRFNVRCGGGIMPLFAETVLAAALQKDIPFETLDYTAARLFFTN